jgi:hypothetical protein
MIAEIHLEDESYDAETEQGHAERILDVYRSNAADSGACLGLSLFRATQNDADEFTKTSGSCFVPPIVAETR